MARFRERLSFANVMSMIAVFVALGGTGYAAVKIPRNAVGASQIKTGGVGSSEVKNGALRRADFRQTDLPQGPQGLQGLKGDKGDKGDKGEDGTADAFARVQADGTLQPDVTGFPPQMKGVASIAKGEGGAATGTYCIELAFTPASAMVSLDNADAEAANRNLVASVAIDRGPNLNDCPATHQDARVRIVDGNTEAATDARFFIWFEG